MKGVRRQPEVKGEKEEEIRRNRWWISIRTQGKRRGRKKSKRKMRRRLG